jgi:2,3-dihydroxyphenylpropionate 1,2-dioxygenase
LDRADYLADANLYANKFNLSHEQRDALIKLDVPAMVKMGTHPLIPFLANMQIQRLRKSR